MRIQTGIVYNIFRSTITDEGLLCLADSPRLVQLVLSLNTQARVTEAALRRLLTSCPGLRVLELGGAANTRSLLPGGRRQAAE